MNSSSSTNCPVCGEERTLKTFGQFTLLVCGICGLYAKTETMFLNGAAELKRYSLHSVQPDTNYSDQMRDFVKTAVFPFIKNGKALDYGAGRTGVISRLLSGAGFEVRTYDPYFDNNLDVLDTTYDLITTIEVVEHFQDLKAEWDKLVGLLKPGGILAIGTQFAKADIRDWWYLRDTTHYHFYQERTFEVLSLKYRMEILYTDHVSRIVFKKGH